MKDKVSLVKAMLDKVMGQSSFEWAEIADLFDVEYSAEHLRKMAQGVRLAQEAGLIGGTDVQAADNNEYRRTQELIRVRDERRELNKLLRNDTRVRAKFDDIEEAITEAAKIRFAPRVVLDQTFPYTEGEMLVCLSDMHIGANYENRFGSYNTQIAQDRLNEYADKVIALARQEKVNRATVVLLGDMISGNIHKEIAVTNRENVIRQVMTASELVARFVYTLSGFFENVSVWSVAGNHSRIDRKEDALKDERLDDIVTWYAGAALQHIENVHIHKAAENPDTTIAEFMCGGANVVAVHGDYDGENEAAVNKLKSFLGYEPDIIVSAHRHAGFGDIGDTTLVRSGSLCGSGDAYTITKRLKGRPMQACA